jgi:tRNA nucleotidyltransferase (CCA-adding enzyme)
MSERAEILQSWQGLPWLSEVQQEGGAAYAVGGAVRDWLRGEPAVDLDVVVCGVPRSSLVELLRRHGRVDDVGASFAVLKWRARGDHAEVDVSLPRVERSTGPAHRDFEVDASESIGIEADLARRDFTINAVALDLISAERVDPFGGISDLESGLLRAVGDARLRFEEDPLRILRGAVLVARLGLEVDPLTRSAMREFAPRLDSLSRERVGGELVKLLARSARPSTGLRLLVDTGALERVVPELIPSLGFEQNNPQHHLDVWEHVLLAVDASARRGAGIAVRLAALLHDVAKPETYSEELLADGSRLGHFYGHEARSAEIAGRILERLRIGAVPGVAGDVPERVCSMVLHHLVSIEPTSSHRVVRRFIRRLGGRAEALELLELWAADRSAHAGGLDEAEYEDLVARIRAAGEVPISQHQLALGGGVIARHFGLAGPAIGELKEKLLEAVVAGEAPSEEAALLGLAERLLAEG